MVSSWRDRVCIGVVVCSLLFVMPISIADDPDPLAQDDAGSGRDAPGEPSKEITIHPGILYHGSSTGPGTDDLDYFHFTGEAGQFFEARADGLIGCYYVYDADGMAIGRSSCAYANAPIYPPPATAELPYTGDYYFLVAHLSPAFYQFAFNLSGPSPEARTVPLLLGAEDPAAPAQPLPIPEGCHGDFEMVPADVTHIPRFLDDCYHMRTDLNSLDTPNIDVLLIPPVSAYPERDLRTMREAVKMWDRGIQMLAVEMGMDWLAEGVNIEIFVDDDELYTDPLWDPEIVVIATNPVGGAGIGVDPLGWFLGLPTPCHGQPNPLASFQDWSALPGFDNHHGEESGTYTAECEGGGPICYAVNGAVDPVPGVIDLFGLFDLVAHEVGHCLTIGHVGDARDHKAANVPLADIMSYTNRPFDKCVSTLDAQSFAVTMSRYLLPTPFAANHADGPGGSFQIQHPEDHWYASPTGLARDCPPPDTSILPGGDPEVLPPQDDAGSGGDAPDSNVRAITILPDVVYEGTLTGFPVDGSDTYHLEGTAGDTFTGWADGTNGCYNLYSDQGEHIKGACNRPADIPLNPGPLVVELPYTGDFFFSIASITLAEYTFGFTFQE